MVAVGPGVPPEGNLTGGTLNSFDIGERERGKKDFGGFGIAERLQINKRKAENENQSHSLKWIQRNSKNFLIR